MSVRRKVGQPGCFGSRRNLINPVSALASAMRAPILAPTTPKLLRPRLARRKHPGLIGMRAKERAHELGPAVGE